MNKEYVDEMLPIAIEAIEKCGIANENGEVSKSFRGQIASFGAAVAMGSFKSAVAFFSENGNASVDRAKLIQAIDYIIRDNKKSLRTAKDICKEILDLSNDDVKIRKDKFLDASIAIKLALNVYTLVEQEG